MGLFKPAQAVAHTAVREGFKAGAAVARQFKAVQKLVRPERFAQTTRASDLFDLNVSEEQQMIRDMAQRFAREVIRPAAIKADASDIAAPPIVRRTTSAAMGAGFSAVSG